MIIRQIVFLLLTAASSVYVRCDEASPEKNPRVGVRDDESTPQKPSGSTWTPNKVHLEHKDTRYKRVYNSRNTLNTWVLDTTSHNDAQDLLARARRRDLREVKAKEKLDSRPRKGAAAVVKKKTQDADRIRKYVLVRLYPSSININSHSFCLLFAFQLMRPFHITFAF